MHSGSRANLSEALETSFLPCLLDKQIQLPIIIIKSQYQDNTQRIPNNLRSIFLFPIPGSEFFCSAISPTCRAESQNIFSERMDESVPFLLNLPKLLPFIHLKKAGKGGGGGEREAKFLH